MLAIIIIITAYSYVPIQFLRRQIFGDSHVLSQMAL